MTWIEIWANITTAICIFLAGRNSIHTWWTGIVSSILFSVLFYTSQLYADTLLQVFFIVTEI
jgi:nicotinamide mononucleotide transporter